MKKALFLISIVLLLIILWQVNDKSEQPVMMALTGQTMGTIGYNIKYLSNDSVDYKKEVDELLKVWNQSLSTYIPNSEISTFNKNTCFEFDSEYFLPVLKASKDVYDNTGGYFDPTVGPLVNAWGFGPAKRGELPDSTQVDSLMQLVGYDKITFDEKKVCKSIDGIYLDFSAVAKGYAVDVVADFIRQKGIENVLVEIGGEIMCYGVNNNGVPWRTAVEDPTVKFFERKLLAVVNLTDMAVATSGNYRNYYEKDGKMYSHTINPHTGYPVGQTLLSASVFADNCMTADAYATAFMAMGIEKSKEVLAKVDGIEAYLVYSGEEGGLEEYITEGIKDKIEKINVSE